jgi:hypothetical protein
MQVIFAIEALQTAGKRAMGNGQAVCINREEEDEAGPECCAPRLLPPVPLTRMSMRNPLQDQLGQLDTHEKRAEDLRDQVSRQPDLLNAMRSATDLEARTRTEWATWLESLEPFRRSGMETTTLLQGAGQRTDALSWDQVKPGLISALEKAHRDAQSRLSAMESKVQQQRKAVEQIERWLERSFDKLDTENSDEVSKAVFMDFVCGNDEDDETTSGCGGDRTSTGSGSQNVRNASICAGNSKAQDAPLTLQRDQAEKLWNHMSHGGRILSRAQFKDRAVESCLEAVEMAANRRRQRRQSFRYTIL